jgi:hypothetical protein
MKSQHRVVERQTSFGRPLALQHASLPFQPNRYKKHDRGRVPGRGDESKPPPQGSDKYFLDTQKEYSASAGLLRQRTTSRDLDRVGHD